MLGYFPPLRKDESLYSAAAEYSQAFLNGPAKDVSLDLFGVDKISDMVDIPCHLQYLADELPKEFNITADYLIQHATALGFFAPFLRRDLLRATIDAMKGDGTGADSFFAGYRIGANNSSSFLRLCLECVAEDRKGGGRTYWRRAPQLPTVHICKIHEMLLATTCVSRGTMVGNRYIHADDIVDLSMASRRSRRAPRQVEQILLWMSEQSHFLLEHSIESIDAGRLNSVYRSRLQEAGFAYRTGRLRIDELADEISNRYIRVGLSRFLPVDFKPGPITRWLWRTLLGKGAPAHNLVLMHFLGISVSDMLSLPESTQSWFEEGPWPCLNPICSNFERDVITSLEVGFLQNKVKAVFACSCGYAYERDGPDRNGNCRNTPARPIENVAWDEALRNVWLNGSLTVEQIKVMLHTGYRALERALLRLGLDPRAKKRSDGGNWPTYVKPIKDIAKKENALKEKHRKTLCAWLERHPNATRSDINSSEVHGAVHWLRKKDRAWIDSRLPAPLCRKLSKAEIESRRIAGAARLRAKDKALAAKVPDVSRKLFLAQDSVQRVSAARIMRGLGYPSHLKSNSGMILSAAALRKYSESVPQFAVRRLRQVVIQIKESGNSVSLARLHKLAGLSQINRVTHHPLVVAALKLAKRALGI